MMSMTFEWGVRSGVAVGRERRRRRTRAGCGVRRGAEAETGRAAAPDAGTAAAAAG